ncbi:hypothetical protein LOS78_03180 [Paracoccus sp. MA]|uniref:hypothetical protein n=1 Tax=Paracoccus sp. MA TaxID=2895796 RepID=UPI001E594225|nr:hypothetical protein [Paracoccus sp. MA]UFM64493.1 hypothetical protein LOS78_03180 [Paracoccus sp. MA]
MMLQLVAAGRCITVLPDWLLREAAASMPIRLLKIGYQGLHKSINLGTRAGESRIEHMAGFFRLVRSVEP